MSKQELQDQINVLVARIANLEAAVGNVITNAAIGAATIAAGEIVTELKTSKKSKKAGNADA